MAFNMDLLKPVQVHVQFIKRNVVNMAWVTVLLFTSAVVQVLAK